MDVRIHYLGWERPFSLVFAEQLLEEAAGSRELDPWMVWTPSARAGRHILNQLFSFESAPREALHPPRFMTAAQFGHSLAEAGRQASVLQQLHAWKTVLLAGREDFLQPLFPVLPRENRIPWAYVVGRQLMQLRQRLAEDEQDFRSVSEGAPAIDLERWQILAELERLYLAHLKDRGLDDAQEGFAMNLAAALDNFPHQRILVAGVLNLSRRQETCLRELAGREIQVDIYVPAPEAAAAGFDGWGRPVTGYWDREPIPSELLEGRILRSGEPRPLVDSVLDLAGSYREDVDALVIGVPDQELGHYLVERSRLTDTAIYAPEGKPLSRTAWGRLIRLVGEWQAGRSLEGLQDLLRHALFRSWARKGGLPVEVMEHDLVSLQKERLFHTVDQLLGHDLDPDQRIGRLREALERIDSVLLAPGEGMTFPEWLWSVLSTVAEGQTLGEESRSVLSRLEEFLQDLLAGFGTTDLTYQDFRELLQYQLETSHYYPERESSERPVSGWLELPWERAPHLVLLGLPDSQVPGTEQEDTFLTPALCRKLELYGPDQNAAFHAFRLRLLLESRRDWGRLDLLLPDRGMDDSPVLPSRFLFLAGEKEITARVRTLLQEHPVPESSLAARFGPPVVLPEPAPLEKISVTDFAAYLRDPFRCYLERILRWQVPQALPRELDPMGFGILGHRVLEAFNRSAEAQLLEQEEDIRVFLERETDHQVLRSLGRDPGVAVRIQVDSLKERLRALSPVLAEQRQAGWWPCKVEWAFHKDLRFAVGGIPLHGKIDLLEKRRESGEYRIIDYKTSDKSDGPFKAHLSGTNSRSRPPLFPEGEFSEGDKTWRWKDLQLPLYRLAVEQELGQRPACAYICLSKAVNEVRLDPWDPSEAQDAGALACAVKIVERMRAGIFPIPDKPAYRDDWQPWFAHEYRSAIDPAWLQQHAEEGT